MKILVLGGTGAMGIHLVSFLVQSGHTVIVTTRRKRVDKYGVKYIQGNAHDKMFLKDLLSIYNLDAIVDFMTYTTSDFESRYKIFLNNTKQYFFLSTSRVYANTPIITEQSPRLLDTINDKEYLATDEYALCKARQEDILRNSGRKNFTIIRPYITYSEKRLQLGVLDKDTTIQRALLGHSIVIPMDIMTHTTTLTYGKDVSECIAKLIGNAKTYGEVYNITSTETISWLEVLECYLNAYKTVYGIKPKVVQIANCPQLKEEIGKYQVIYDRLYDRKFDNSKILETIGGHSFTSSKDGLRKCMISFLKTPEFEWFDGKQEGLHDRYAHEFTKISRFPTNQQRLLYLLYRLVPKAQYVHKLLMAIKSPWK